MNDDCEKSFIFGTTDLAVMLYENMLSLGKDIAGFVVDDDFVQTSHFFGKKIVPFSKVREFFSPDEYSCYICVGYNGMNAHRSSIYDKLEALGYSILNFIHPSAEVNSEVLGQGNLIFQNVLIDFHTEIGKGNIFYPNSLIAHHNKIGDFNFFAVSCCVTGHVIIQNNNFIGANSTIGNGVELKGFCLIGAGAYVSFDVEKGKVVVPARSMVLENKISTDFL